MLGLAAAVSSVQHAMPRARLKGHMTFFAPVGSGPTYAESGARLQASGKAKKFPPHYIWIEALNL